MATLSALAKTQQTTSVQSAQGGAVGSPGGTSITPVKTLNNTEKLIRDIGNQAGDILVQHQEASTYAGKRVGTDNLVEYKNSMNTLTAYYADKEAKGNLTSSDMIAKNRDEQGLYESYMQKGHFGDNELANQAFIDTYSSPAYDNLLRNRTQNDIDQASLLKDETRVEVTNEIEILGYDISAENLATYKQRYKTVGLDPESVTASYLAAAGSSLTKEMNNSHSLYYDKAGNIKQDAVDSLVEKHYKLVLDTDSDLSSVRYKADAFIETQAKKVKSKYISDVKAMARSMIWKGPPYQSKKIDGTNDLYYHYAPTYADFEKAINARYPLLTETEHRQIMDIYTRPDKIAGSGGTTSADQYVQDTNLKLKDTVDSGGVLDSKVSDHNNAWTAAIMNDPNVSEPLKNTVFYKNAKVMKQNRHNIQIQRELPTFTAEELTLKLARGSFDENGQMIKGDEYTKVVNRVIAAKEADIKTMDINSQEDANAFRVSLDETQKYATAQKKDSPSIFTYYSNQLTNVAGSTKSIKEMKQLSEYVKYANDRGDQQLGLYLDDIDQLDQALNNPDLSTEQKILNANAILSSIAIKKTQKRFNEEDTAIFKAAIKETSEGAGILTLTDLEVPRSAIPILKRIYNGSPNAGDMRRSVLDLGTYDLGAGTSITEGLYDWTLKDDRARLYIPKGLTHREFGGFIGRAIDAHNVGKNNPITEDDIDAEMVQAGLYSFSWRLTLKSNGRYIGTVGRNGYNYIKGRE